VYILYNRNGTLYTGVTNDLVRRVHQHKHRRVPGFTCRYVIDRLVYFEGGSDIRVAIARGKEIKGWRRSKKVALVDGANLDWQDLSAGRYDNDASGDPSRSSEE
jgi:putative endonuclease